MARIVPIAAAGLVALAVPLPVPAAVTASQTGKTPLIVAQAPDDPESAAAGRRMHRLLMAALAQRGHHVLDEAATPSVPGAVILRVATDLRIFRGTYTTRATIALRATLVDADTKRFLARFDHGPGVPWRLVAHCPQFCIDQDVQRRIGPLAERIAADVDRRLVRLGRERIAEAVDRNGVSIAFRRIDRSLLPQIEQYLRNFPGVSRIRRDSATGEEILYRLHPDGTVGATDLSLRKMLHHLRLSARIARTGNSFVVEGNPAAKPAAGSQDW